MGSKKPKKDRSRHKRVALRHNRQKPARQKHWALQAEDHGATEDAPSQERVRAKGDLSRKRTVIEGDDADRTDGGRLEEGAVMAVRGQFVEVVGAGRIWPCTVRRKLRTRKIEERHPVTVGDRVSFSVIADSEGQLNEGVIEQVHPRRTELKRSEGRRTHTIAANVDQVLVVMSVREPMLKPHLLDRYLVAAHAGGLPAIICLNKIDLDEDEEAEVIVDRYAPLGYTVLATSVVSGAGIDRLRERLRDRVTLLAGQSGVGKSSLLNAVQPGLKRDVARVSTHTEKGRHTTTTAVWLPLEAGGAVIDTPGIRALDVAMVPVHELEMHFVEFVDRLAGCKFPDCVHIHEEGCAIKAAVGQGQIDPSRYESYLQMFIERPQQKW